VNAAKKTKDQPKKRIVIGEGTLSRSRIDPVARKAKVVLIQQQPEYDPIPHQQYLAEQKRLATRAESERHKRRKLGIDDAGRIGFEPVPVIVDDPNGGKIGIMRNRRADPVEMLFSRKVIDSIQKPAAMRVMRALEAAEIGGAGAIDYSKPKVDGGKLSDPMNDHVMQAQLDLRDIAWKSGPIGFLMLQQAIGYGEALNVISLRFGGGRSALGYVTYRLREALDALVDHWGMKEAIGSRSRYLRVSHETTTGPQREWEVDTRSGIMREKA